MFGKLNEPHPCRHTFSPSYVRLGIVEAEENGVLVKKSDFQTFDNSVELKKFNSHDFDIANILAVGAYDVLKPVSIGKMSDMSVADNLEIALNSFSNSKSE